MSHIPFLTLQVQKTYHASQTPSAASSTIKCLSSEPHFVDPRTVEFVRGRSTNLALSTRGIEPLKIAGALESVSFM